MTFLSHTRQFRTLKKTHQKRIKDTLRFLRETRLAKHKQAPKLSDLPWHLVIGPTSCGKTSLLANAQIPFVLEKKTKDLKGSMPPTQNYDFWVTNSGTFIDTPGIHFNFQHKTNRKLNALFFKMLSKYMAYKTPASILIVADIDFLLNTNSQNKQTFTAQLSLYLKFINKYFQKPIPLFFIIDKCDQICGFREFFGELSQEERFQIWGCPLNQNSKKKKATLSEFKDKLNEMLWHLESQLIWRLKQARTIDERVLINAFHFEMRRLKPKLYHFIKEITNQIQKHKRLAIRGTFLTSNCQTPLSSAQKSHNYSDIQALINITQSTNKAYFTHDLLSKLILPLGQTQKSPQKKSLKIGMILAGLISTVLLASTWLYSFNSQIKAINQANQAITNFRITQHLASMQQNELAVQLNALDDLKNAQNTLKKQTLSPLLIISPNKALKKLALYTNTLYVQALETTLLPIVTHDLTTTLTSKTTPPDLRYSALFSYLMLGYPNLLDQNILLSCLQNIWQNALPPALYTKLLFDFATLLQTKPISISLSQSLIEDSRERLKQIEPTGLGFIILKNSVPFNQALALNLSTNKNAAFIFTFAKSDIHIDSLYTPSLFNKIHETLIEQAATESLHGNIVLGSIQNQAESENPKELTEKIQQIYLQNYAAAWLTFIDNIKIINFTDLNQLAKAVQLLSQNNSPLIALMNLINQNMTASVLANNNRLAALADAKNMTSPYFIDNIQKTFIQLNNDLAKITQAKDPDQQAFIAARFRMQNNAGLNDSITQLFTQAELAPEPLKSWLYNLALNTWQLILYQAQAYIDQAWQTSVTPQWNAQLNNRYPFDETGNTQANLKSFNYFFAKNGLLNQFMQTYLSPFLTQDGSNLQTKTVEGAGLEIPNVTLQTLEQIKNITHRYFQGFNQTALVHFKIQLTSKTDNIANIMLKLGSQQLTFLNKDDTAELVWPDDIDADLVSIVIETKDGNKIILNKKGPWGLMRFLNENSPKKIDDNTWQIDIERSDLSATLQIQTQNKENPFDITLLSSLQLPESLLS